MECHVLRGILKYRCLQAAAGHPFFTSVKADNGLTCGFQMTDRRLYHHDSSQLSSRFRRVNLLSAPALSTNGSFVFQPHQTRSIIISKVIDGLRSADLTSAQGISKFIMESGPVTAVSSLYEWSEAVTGLPWAANILLCSVVLQLIFNAPAVVYLAKWQTAKEKHTADMVAINSTVMRAPSRESIAMFTRAYTDLTKHYGCQNYKLYLTILYQILCVSISSFGVRSLLLNPNLGLKDALLPWGTCLGLHDITFILPVANVAMSLLLVEIGAWKKLGSVDGLKMTLKRASAAYKPEPLYLLNIRRFCAVPLIAIYLVVPSALTLHWFAMVAVSINVQILLSHRQTRRTLGIPACYYETDNPYKDFLQYLRKDLTVLGKKA